MLSRRNEFSHASITCLRLRPRRLGPGAMAPLTLVATTTSSRCAISPSQWPVIVSLRPTEYTSAVSKKVTPASSAAAKCSRASSLFKAQSRGRAQSGCLPPP